MGYSFLFQELKCLWCISSHPVTKEGTYALIFRNYFSPCYIWQGLLTLLPAWPAGRGSRSFPAGRRGWRSRCSPPGPLCLPLHGPAPPLRVPSSPPTCVLSENITCPPVLSQQRSRTPASGPRGQETRPLPHASTHRFLSTWRKCLSLSGQLTGVIPCMLLLVCQRNREWLQRDYDPVLTYPHADAHTWRFSGY